ncbi:type IV pili twitching motility protein PilT [candidate division KSB3 bacterium]|uniref:Type IV pili twitching motility protein PilT n=1 Tax=candidate division KSB3 bacterium TaxID=2044937 RepID=A0A2G6EBA6_9BACT|nr:MAG: type IV pili twitching motility protein PilT [candidate division KSB3 bacterium]PIE30706.1 MAG: type IV pili twitching motility protein PilT [candidate division KSB3 bacterium]
MADLHDLLSVMHKRGASDLHISAEIPPTIRIDGELTPIESEAALKAAETKSLVYSVLTDAQKHMFEENNELDFSFGIKGLCRFRGNAFVQRGTVGAVFRTIPYQILSFRDLGLSPAIEKFSEKPMGLILVTGPTGSGKSTTLAALVDKINRERRAHIITIEDPIEFLHEHRSCVVNQREVHSDTQTFGMALRHVLRQDPDVILIGEMRDLETIEAALMVAETGHLVFATLHTNSCAQTINRVIDVFPPHQQTQVRTQLSFVLEGVVTQQLIPRASGKGRVVATEVMVPTAAIRNLIREDKIHQIYSQMQIGQEKFGMRTMNQSLIELYQKRHISRDEAIRRSPNLEEFSQMMARVQAGGKGAAQRTRR